MLVPPPPPAIIVADRDTQYNRAIKEDRDNKDYSKKLGTKKPATYGRQKPHSKLARLKLKPGEKKVFVSPYRYGDNYIMGGRLNGKRGIFQTYEKVGPDAYNYYSRGVVVKVRERNGRLKVIGINTSQKKAKVGLRYKKYEPGK